MLPLLVTTTLNTHAASDLRWTLDRCRPPRLRNRRDFCEQEIVLGEGPYAGRALRLRRQPFAGLLVDEMNSGRWRRYAITGAVQSGKTLFAVVLPCLYYLFEMRETVILGIPTMDMAGDKWRNELLPVIERTRYRDLLPLAGKGSRGGTPEAIRFRHGVELRFMSGHGGDEKRSGYTSRVVVITEADKMDTAGETSREASPLAQMEARTLAFGEAARVYLECTVSIEEGAIWQEYQSGSRSRIHNPCPHCSQFVAMERDDLVVDYLAASAAAARRSAAWYCPACGERIDDAQRAAMNAAGVLVHDGQEITPAGDVVGPLPETDTLGFRWHAWHNLFWSTSDIAAQAWADRRTQDPDLGERRQRQFFWCQPVDPDEIAEHDLDPYKLAERLHDSAKRGEVPDGFGKVTVGVDVGSRHLHWIAIAWGELASAHVVDYGKLHVFSAKLGVERALHAALKYLRDKILLPGFDGVRPSMVWIDSGWKSGIVYAFARDCEQHDETRGWIRPVAGRGWQKAYGGQYSGPKLKTRSVRIIGEQYHFVRDARALILRGLANADYWKSFFLARLATPAGEPGSVTLPVIGDGDHSELTRHWCSEKEVRFFDPQKGAEITKWQTISRANHWFDASYLAAAAGHMAGVQATDETTAAAPQPAAWFSERRKR